MLHPARSGEKIDVRGGWHDAADYLQYLPTSANATFQMMFAYTQTADKSILQTGTMPWGAREPMAFPIFWMRCGGGWNGW